MPKNTTDFTQLEFRFPDDATDYAPWVAKHGLRAPYGECQCCCGGDAPIADRNRPNRGHALGKPKRFVAGHQNSLGGTVARFWRQVDKRGPNDCWLWVGTIDRGVYGNIMVEGKTVLAHRFAYELHYGPIPTGERVCVCHSCDIRACTNWSHLWLGTDADNNADMIAKGRNVILPGELNGCAKLTEERVRASRQRHAAGVSYAELAREYGVTRQAIYAAVTRKKWKHVP